MKSDEVRNKLNNFDEYPGLFPPEEFVNFLLNEDVRNTLSPETYKRWMDKMLGQLTFSLTSCMSGISLGENYHGGGLTSEEWGKRYELYKSLMEKFNNVYKTL